jgi:pimeloyl-ACP methyl ester carboxylesterase
MYGTNQTLVLLPGLLCDEAVWTPILQALNISDHYWIADYAELDDLAAMAKHVLNQVEGDQLIVFGHSMGGRIAMEIMRHAPQRVSRLGLFDTAFRSAASGEKGDQEKQKRMDLLATAQQSGMRVMAQQWALGMVHPQFHHTAVFESILDMIERKTPAIFAAQIHTLLNRQDAECILRQINCPTLLLCGEEDLWSPISVHQEMQALIKNATLSVIPNCAHMSTMEQPKDVANAISSWLKAI